MFEHCTEVSRRAIFFARYEAGRYGAPYMEAEHLLLGLLREDRVFQDRLPAGAAEQIRQRIEERVPQPVQPLATSVDLALSQDSRRSQAYAAEESMALRHSAIDCGHLLLGTRLPRSGGGASRNSSARQRPAGSLGHAFADLQRLLGAGSELEDSAGQRLKRAGWTRKQAFWPPDRLGGRASAMARARFLRTEARRQRISRR